jgi:hypothetical protein
MDNDITYDHYKETCELSRAAQKDRNKYFVFLCISIGVLLLLSLSPDTIIQAILIWVKNSIDANIVFDVSLIQSFMWVATTYITTRYIQTNIYIEKLYPYIENLEKAIGKNLGDKTEMFNRESKNYLKEYPIVQDFIFFIYTRIFPLMYLIVISGKAFLEWFYQTKITTYLIVDSILALVIVILIILYCVFQYQIAKKYK